MSKSPAFQFYPRDWIGDPEIMLMDWDARAMHLHCMCIAWMNAPACAIENCDKKLMRWLNVFDSEDWEKRLKPQIFSAWTLEGEYWVQKRLLREKTKQLENSEKKKRAAESRWKGNAAPHDAPALQMECSSSSSSTAVVKEKNKQKRKTLVSENWQENEKTKTWFCKQKFDFSIDDMREQYITACHAKGLKYVNHDAALKNWSKRRHEQQQAAPHRRTNHAENMYNACKEFAESDTGDLDSEPVRETGGTVRPQVVEFIPRRHGESGDG